MESGCVVERIGERDTDCTLSSAGVTVLLTTKHAWEEDIIDAFSLAIHL